jgi:hypothetical protein
MHPRVAYVSPITPGSEGEVREAHRQLPERVLSEAGLSGVTAFLGNGYYVLVFELPEGDFQESFARLANHPEARGFFDALGGRLLEPLPLNVQPGDSVHHEAAAAPTNGERATTTARLPLVGEVFRWEAAH